MTARTTQKLTSRRRQRFLDALANGLSVSGAARMAGVSRQALYRLRARDDAFRAAWADGLASGADRIEDEAVRRAVDGVEKPVFRGGQIVGHVRDYSDTMLMFLLKARRPDRYQAKAADTGKTDATPDPLEGSRDALYAKLADRLERIRTEAPDGKPDGEGGGHTAV
ncbi:helix-turn-helix domain-containing protein [Yunchengibacter salinarum]|uniref:helix-turn-helix domain-containing protein n=1 Tax=Yunchengibacter salinarum TaxID=3133399 RepID=UPI0035B646CD